MSMRLCAPKKFVAQRVSAASSSDAGFTMVEILVVIVILGVLASIAVPVFLAQQVRSKDTAARSELAESVNHLVRGMASGTVVLDETTGSATSGAVGGNVSGTGTPNDPLVISSGPLPATLPGIGSIAAAATHVSINPASNADFCLYTISETGATMFWVVGTGFTEQPPTYCATDAGYTVTRAPGGIQELLVDNGSTNIEGSGVFSDPLNGVTIDRQPDHVGYSFAAANWENLTVSYVAPNGGTVTDTVRKTGRNGAAGVLTRVDPKTIRISLPAGTELSVSVIFNGKSSGVFYRFQR